MENIIMFDYILKNNTGFHHKIYTLSQIEESGLCNLFDVENYEIIAKRLFINLRDKNNKSVFTGDRIRYFGGQNHNGVYEYGGIGVAKFKNGSIYIDCNNVCIDFGNVEFFEIIRNIYE